MQQRFDAAYGKAATILSVQGQSAAELEAFMPSVLDRAFRGEL
jgi:hypothetical protein